MNRGSVPPPAGSPAIPVGGKKFMGRAGVKVCCSLGLLLLLPLPALAADVPDVFTQDVARFTRLLSSPSAERRVEGANGLSHLKCWPAEEELIERLTDPSPAVRRAVVIALGRLGSAISVRHLIGLLEDPAWEIRQHAWRGLTRLTAQSFPAQPKAAWESWWAAARTNYAATLLAAADRPEGKLKRPDALRSLVAFAAIGHEPALLRLAAQPGLSVEERASLAEALERIGTINALPTLVRLGGDAAAWALGRLGGPEAERALLSFPKTLPVLINLDRVHSTNAGPLLPFLVAQMGLVTYRGQPDDLMNHDAQPIQRVGANLIRRSGRAAEFIRQVLLELEYSMAKPPATPRPPIPPDWQPMLERMRSELKPGFVREDGVTTSQPVTALYHVAEDRALVPRLMPLLRHPAFVPRIYVAMTLAKLGAQEALPALIELIREGYAFSDSVALASGKHFDQSQTVRWRGFLCMAVGRLGGDDARVALETLAMDPKQPRDIRYGSVVGLGFLGAPASVPALNQVARSDIIWMVREEARRATEEIQSAMNR